MHFSIPDTQEFIEDGGNAYMVTDDARGTLKEE